MSAVSGSAPAGPVPDRRAPSTGAAEPNTFAVGVTCCVLVIVQACPGRCRAPVAKLCRKGDLMELVGGNIIGGENSARGGEFFRAVNPRDGSGMEPAFTEATVEEVERAAALAHATFHEY